MIGFITWPPLCNHCYKGGQVTKPIIVVKIHYKLLCVILILKFLVTSVCNASDWCRTFLFLFSIQFTKTTACQAFQKIFTIYLQKYIFKNSPSFLQLL